MTCPAYAKYSGGTGVPNDPYKIATTSDLSTLGQTPEDYDKYFIMIEDIDFLSSGKIYEKAVIAPAADDTFGDFQNIPFTGVFDGKGHTISSLTIKGMDYLGLFGELDAGAKVMNIGLINININASGNYIGGIAGKSINSTVTQCYSTGTISGKEIVGGIVGYNSYGYIISCYSTGAINSYGELVYVGGLVGYNSYGTIAKCYCTGMVIGSSSNEMGIARAGGLVGFNSYGTITQCYSNSSVRGNCETGGLIGTDSFGKVTKCYSTGAVSETGSFSYKHTGGLIGSCLRSYVSQCYSTGHGATLLGQINFGTIIACFWDTQTSGQTSNVTNMGTGKTTAQMKTLSTFTNAGWDFTGEIANGTEDIWRICETSSNYPFLVWQLPFGDLICPDGITLEDIDFLVDHYDYYDCNKSNNYCDGADLNFSGTVDIDDLEILMNIWLGAN